MDNQDIYIEKDTSELANYWDLVKRKIWILLAVFALVYTILMIQLFKEVPLFKSSSLVRISRQSIVSSIVDEEKKEGSLTSYLQTQIQIINSKSVMQLLKDSLKVRNDEGSGSASYRVRVKPLSNTSLISITVESSQPEMTALVANLIPSCYMEIVRKNQQVSSNEALRWLLNEIDKSKVKISGLHAKIQYYDSLGGFQVGDEKSGSKFTLEIQKEESERKYIQAKLSRLDLENKFTLANKFLKNKSNDIATVPSYLRNDIINNLLAGYSALKIDISEKKNFYGDKHPVILELKSKLKNMKRNLKSALELRIKEFFQEKEYALSNEKMYQTNLSNIEAEINSRKSNDFEKSKIREQIANAKKTYDLLLKKSKEMEILENSDLTKFSVVDEALVPGRPFKPNFVRQSIVNLILALMVGCAFIYLLEFMDTKITNFEKAKTLNAPYLGEIELTARGKDGRILNLDKNDHYFKEYIKSYFVNMQYMARDPDKMKKLMFTSTIPKEGKTFSIINTGLWLAGEGKKTIILDMDFYQGQIVKEFKIENPVGMTNYLEGDLIEEEIINNSGFPNLDIIGKGTQVLQISIMNRMEKINTLFKYLESQYDTILIDTPPLKVMADIVVLAKQVSMVIYVVNARKTSKWIIKRNINKLHEQGVEHVGILLNQVRKNTSHSAYYANYYRNYYDKSGETGEGPPEPTGAKDENNSLLASENELNSSEKIKNEDI